MHVDVPIRQTRWSVIDKVGWLVTGLVAPDLLLYVACCQLYRAHVVLGEARKYLHVDCTKPSRSWFRRWWRRLIGFRLRDKVRFFFALRYSVAHVCEQPSRIVSWESELNDSISFEHAEKAVALEEFCEVHTSTYA